MTPAQSTLPDPRGRDGGAGRRPAPGNEYRGLAMNQRAHVRYPCGPGLGLRLAVRPTYRGHRALIHDLSAGGVGLLLAERLEVGTTIAIEVGGDSEAAQSRRARVVHTRPHAAPPDAPWRPKAHPLLALVRRLLGGRERAADCWFIGCQFDEPLTEEELRRLV
jgi:hypothetical protein